MLYQPQSLPTTTVNWGLKSYVAFEFTHASRISQSSHPILRTILALTQNRMARTIVAIVPRTNCITIISAARETSPSGGGFILGGADMVDVPTAKMLSGPQCAMVRREQGISRYERSAVMLQVQRNGRPEMLFGEMHEKKSAIKYVQPYELPNTACTSCRVCGAISMTVR